MGNENLIPHNSHAIRLSSDDEKKWSLLKARMLLLKQRTRETYASGLKDFCSFYCVHNPETVIDLVAHDLQVVLQVSRMTQIEAERWCLEWRADLGRRMSSHAANTYLTSIRWLMRNLKECGLISWVITNLPNFKAKAYRDTTGHSLEEYNRVLHAAAKQTSPWAAARDLAVIKLLYLNAMRRFEVAGLDLEHFDEARAEIWPLCKKQDERTRVELSREMVDALRNWISYRGTAPGPLFLSNSFAASGDRRLSGKSIYKIVARHAVSVGLRPGCHRFRHTAGTQGYKETHNIRGVQRLLGHAKVSTTEVYDDDRMKGAREISEALSRAAARSRLTEEQGVEIEEFNG